MNFHCTKCAGCCTKENFAAIPSERIPDPIRFRENGNCVHLTTEKLCAVYDSRPYLCNIGEMFERPDLLKGYGKPGNVLFSYITAIKRDKGEDAKKEWFKFTSGQCNELIQIKSLGDEFLIDLNKQYKGEQK